MDSDDAVKIVRIDDHYVIKREFDGAWQNTVWIRPLGGLWSVSRRIDSAGTRADNLEMAVEGGVQCSREALNRYRPGESQS